MVKSCCAIGCTNRFLKERDISFHKFPTDEKRKALWIHAIKRKNWKPSLHTFICGKHFQTGKPNGDKNHPDFIPNVFAFSKGKTRDAKVYEARQKLHLKRSFQKSVKAAEENVKVVPPLQLQNDLPSGNTSETDDSAFQNASVATDLLGENKKFKNEIENLKQQLQENTINTALETYYLKNEITVLKQNVDSSYFPNVILSDCQKLTFFTGLPSKNSFDWIFSITKDYINRTFSISKEHQLLLVLIKLRMAFFDEDLAIRFNTSRRTVKRIFKLWLPILAGRLKYLIFWPSHKKIRKTVPSCFKKSLYKDTICIIDCTEIHTQRPSNLKTRNQMWSNYKRHLTMKFLVAITPQGHICYISKCWGGRATDSEITVKSGIMEHLKPGDVVLADRGFNLAPYFQLEGVRLIVPAYTKGKNQLSAAEVLKSKRISNVRIHVERVIGYLKKFKILNNTLPITETPFLDTIITVCAAISNLWPTTVL